MKFIDGRIFKRMVISACNNLYNHYPEVDALNVFPVPDGDTGMNMNLTMTSGMKEIANRNDEDLYGVGKTFSRGLLMGARGNSGVITSQIFRGFTDSLQNKSQIDAVGLAEAFDSGRKVAYKAVIKPVEGTILTVIREASAKLLDQATNKMTIEQAFKILLSEAYDSLERTPNLLPVLKEVGVVDSGGAGLLKILEGMSVVVNGGFVERNEATVEINGQAQAQFEGDDEFGYCTEFVMRLGPDSVKKVFNKNRFTSVLNAHGNSLVVVQDEDIVKVHVHTLKPGDIFNYAQQFGEFIKLKCENMTEQHNEILFNEQNKNGTHMAASELKQAPLAAPKVSNKPKEKFAVIAISVGDGVDELFKEAGTNYIVSGGQTMNPSTNDIIKAIENANAETVFVLPNNGNIIMAANQARDVLKDNINVIVIPSKTIMQGVVASMNFNPELSAKDNEEVMNDSLSTVKSGQVTFAIKDTEIYGVSVKKDNYMAILNSKEILSCHKNKFDALKTLLGKMIDEDSSVITVLLGSDVADEKEVQKVEKYIERKFKNCDYDVRIGNQPVYSYIVGVE
ncbi:MAG: DAK2 domain-containing protein [Candidatus Onthovivens sp.]|nr:DAK2 domain-containing protein [Candidatus Onthovivens sp.]